jgi:hypothetical protein
VDFGEFHGAMNRKINYTTEHFVKISLSIRNIMTLNLRSAAKGDLAHASAIIILLATLTTKTDVGSSTSGRGLSVKDLTRWILTEAESIDPSCSEKGLLFAVCWILEKAPFLFLVVVTPH